MTQAPQAPGEMTAEEAAKAFADKWHFGSAQMRDLIKLLSTRDAARDAELAEAKAQARTLVEALGRIQELSDQDHPKFGKDHWVTFNKIFNVTLEALRSPSPSPGQNT